MEAIRQGGAGLRITQPIRWHRKGSFYEFKAQVANNLGRNLKLIGIQSDRKPHALALSLHCTSESNASVYRLCVRGIHKNKSLNRKRHEGSHLHEWMAGLGDKHAVEPHDPPWPVEGWVESSTAPLTGSEQALLLMLFCQTIKVEIDMEKHWSPIPEHPMPRTFVTLPNGEEIP